MGALAAAALRPLFFLFFFFFLARAALEARGALEAAALLRPPSLSFSRGTPAGAALMLMLKLLLVPLLRRLPQLDPHPHTSELEQVLLSLLSLLAQQYKH